MSKGEGGIPPELSSMLGSLLSNPAALSAVGSLLSGMGLSEGDRRSEEYREDRREGHDDRASCDRCEPYTYEDRRDRCDREDRCDGCDGDRHCHDRREDNCPKAPPILPPMKPHRRGEDCRRDDRGYLLDALRPYLSPARCDMVDSLLRILELLEMIRRRR